MKSWDPCPCWKHDSAAVLVGLVLGGLIGWFTR